jgi:general L-amino acid transport system permease protein
MALRIDATLRGKTAPWNNPVIRGWAIQIGAVGTVAALLCFLVETTIDNLQRQQIASGFQYLQREAGFEISESMISYSPESSYGRALLVGLLNTVRVSGIAIVTATILGTLIGIGRLSPNWLLGRLCEGYVETFRNVPVLLWLMFFYRFISDSLPGPREAIQLLWGTVFVSNRGLYVPVPSGHPIHAWMGYGLLAGLATAWLLARWARKRRARTGRAFPVVASGVALVFGAPLVIWLLGGTPHGVDWPVLAGFNFTGGLAILPEFAALLLALVVYFAAFIADVVRSGIVSVGKGQADAAAALGLTRRQETWLILLPQAMRVIVPPLSNQYLRIVRSSSLAIAVGYPDLVATANVTINQTGQAIENILIIVAAYLTVSLAISGFMNWYNKRVALKGVA